MAYDYVEDLLDRERRHFDWMSSTFSRMTMLRSLRDTCKDCIMCRLGREVKVVRGERIDPHVFSTMTPSKFVVVGQNPGFNECKEDEPFIGDAGVNFNEEIAKHGMDRKDFYITNIVKCHTDGNTAPGSDIIERCKLFLLMEMNIMMPKLVITLGKSAFGFLCPNSIYAKALGALTYSEIIDRRVFAIYHPSPNNLAVEARRRKYEHDIGLLCKLIKVLKQKEQ